MLKRHAPAGLWRGGHGGLHHSGPAGYQRLGPQELADARTDALDAVQGFFFSRRSAGTWLLVALLPMARILSGSAPPLIALRGLTGRR